MEDAKIETFEYIYLLQTSDLFDTTVFKFGKTKTLHTRFDGYDNQVAIYYIIRVKNCTLVENKIKQIFKLSFTKYTQGNEYYSGNYINMINTIQNIINNLEQKHTEQDNFKQLLERFYKYRHIIKLDYREPIIIKNNPYIEPDNGLDNESDIDLNTDSNDESNNESNDESNNESNDEINLKTEFKCDKCNQTFTQKVNLKYHINKNVCGSKHIILDDFKDYHCKYCNKGFSSDSSMYRHMKHSCKIKKNDRNQDILKTKEENELLKKNLETIKREKNDLLKKNLKLLKKRSKKISPKTITNNNVSGNIINNNVSGDMNNYNIILVEYKQTDIDKKKTIKIKKIYYQTKNKK